MPLLTHRQSQWTGHNSLLPFWICIIFEKKKCCPWPKVVWWGRVERITGLYLSVRLPVCLSVWLFVCSYHIRPILLTGILDLDILQNGCPWPKYLSLPLTRIISPSARSICIHSQNVCPGHNSLLACWIWKIFHTIVVNDPEICHNLEHRS